MSFRRRRSRGSVALLAGLLAIPLVAFAGFAIDAGRMWLVQSRLQASIDAAVLLAARLPGASGTANAVALFWADFGRTSDLPVSGNGYLAYLGAVALTPVVTQLDSSTVQMTGQATVATPLIGIVGPAQVTVHGTAVAKRQSTGLEVALVLDNTGSMAGWPIQSVITSATSLVNILYGGGAQDTLPNLWISVVPFTAEVNIGPTNINWLAAGSLNPNAYLNTTWTGCVMARVATGDDFTDATPSQAPFTPFLYPSTLGKYTVTTKGKTQAITGDNDWSPTNITEGQQDSLGDGSVGPNLGCSPLPVLPETASRTTVLNTISKMDAIHRGGTFINLGLQAGWWTLSPKWRGLWGNPTLPLDYNTPFMQKVMVLMTDGNNEWYDWPGGAPGVGPSPWADDGDTDFSAYGRVNQNLMGLPPPNNWRANATTNINTKMTTMCNDHQAGRNYDLHHHLQPRRQRGPVHHHPVSELCQPARELLPDADRRAVASRVLADRRPARQSPTEPIAGPG